MTTSSLKSMLPRSVSLVRTISHLPAELVRNYSSWLVESPVGHHATGMANGMFGAHLAVHEMTIRVDHRAVGLDHRSLAAAFPAATGSLVVFLHGLVETERSWFRATEHDYGARLAEDFDASPVHVRYNTGRHVCDNGGDLVTLLSRLVDAWPVPVTDIVLIGHSMGGLVARSALYQAQEPVAPWLSRVTRLVCLGTPHSGAALERWVARFAQLLARSPVTTPLTKLLALRSNGIQDLAHGCVHRDQWAGPESQPGHPVPNDIRRLFVSATLSRRQGSVWGRLIGDLLVTPIADDDLTEQADVVWLGGLNHFALQHDDVVYETVRDWLRAGDSSHKATEPLTAPSPIALS